MGNRRKARELAMQALFYMDSRNALSEEGISLFCKAAAPPQKSMEFFEHLTHGVISTMTDLDKILERFSNNWKVSRMSCVDRNVMRIAVFEMLCCDEIPDKVAINEAIDIGKKFGTEDSGAFINGILDSIRKAKEADDAHVAISHRMPVPQKITVPVFTGKTVLEKEADSGKDERQPSVAVSANIRKRHALRETGE
jgi:transcription antitermination protein NusB